MDGIQRTAAQHRYKYQLYNILHEYTYIVQITVVKIGIQVLMIKKEKLVTWY